MDYCNGTYHYWSDDSYDSGSYPCPGPDHCANARKRPRDKEAEVFNIKVSIPVSVGAYTGQREDWEEYDHDFQVHVDGTRVILTDMGPSARSRQIKFNKADLDAALQVLNNRVTP